MKRPLISVVIPVLNERDRVGTLVGELRHANSAPFEIIVIDGGSNDGTVQAAQNLDAQAAITIGVSEPGRGPQACYRRDAGGGRYSMVSPCGFTCRAGRARPYPGGNRRRRLGWWEFSPDL